MEKDIGRIPKGEYQGIITEIVVGIKEFNGKVGIDIREFTQSETYTGPTKKGLRIPVNKFEEFKTIINSINSADLKSEVTEKVSAQPQREPTATEDDDAGIDEQGWM